MRSLPATAAAALSAAVLSLAGGNVVAQPNTGTGAKASAGFTGVHFGVVDLRPNDGQAAGFSTVAGDAQLLTYHTYPNNENRLNVPPLQAGRLGISDGSKTFAGTLGNYGDLYANAGINYAHYEGKTLRAFAQQQLEITLAPHSALSLAGMSNFFTQRDPNQPEFQLSGASTSIRIDTNTSGLPSTYVSFSHVPQFGMSGSESKDFALFYTNPSGQPLRIFVDFSIGAYATIASIPSIPSIPSISSVPEPGSYAMMGAGLLLIGALGRRKRGTRA